MFFKILTILLSTTLIATSSTTPSMLTHGKAMNLLPDSVVSENTNNVQTESNDTEDNIQVADNAITNLSKKEYDTEVHKLYKKTSKKYIKKFNKMENSEIQEKIDSFNSEYTVGETLSEEDQALLLYAMQNCNNNDNTENSDTITDSIDIDIDENDNVTDSNQTDASSGVVTLSTANSTSAQNNGNITYPTYSNATINSDNAITNVSHVTRKDTASANKTKSGVHVSYKATLSSWVGRANNKYSTDCKVIYYDNSTKKVQKMNWVTYHTAYGLIGTSGKEPSLGVVYSGYMVSGNYKDDFSFSRTTKYSALLAAYTSTWGRLYVKTNSAEFDLNTKTFSYYE